MLILRKHGRPYHCFHHEQVIVATYEIAFANEMKEQLQRVLHDFATV